MAKPLLNKALAVGLLVAIAGAGFLVAFTFFKKGGYAEQDSYRVFVLFEDATGLTWKSRVQIAGIQVGEVEQISLQAQRARLDLRIRKEVDLRADACVTKRFPSALLPDAILDVAGGSDKAPSLRDLPEAERQVKCVNEGVTVSKLLESLQKISADISVVSGELAQTVGGTQGSIRQVIENLARISQNLDLAVSENSGKLSSILDNANSFTGTLAGVAAADKERYRAIARNTEDASARLVAILTSLQDIVGTDGRADLKESVGSARAALEKLNRSLEDVQKATERIAEGKGVAGKLLADERLGEKVGSALEGLSGYVERVTKLQLQIQLRSEWLLNQKGAKTYAGIHFIPREDKYYILEIVNDPRAASTTTVERVTTEQGGVTTTATTTKQLYDQRLRFSFQFAKRYGPATFRIGVIESSGGVGADLHLLGDDLKFSVNLYQFSRPEGDCVPPPPPGGTCPGASWFRTKVWVDYRFLKYFYATAGGDDVLNTWKSGRYPGGPRFSIGRDVFVGGGLVFTDDDLKTLFLVGGSAVSGATSSGGGVR
ncbi:MAG TPA: MlaD family protein [Anaeromyxobacteraceae bacterium]|jgi:phospholipid/cholesterol/gamma-HCH transport system substrate-binding protein